MLRGPHDSQNCDTTVRLQLDWSWVLTKACKAARSRSGACAGDSIATQLQAPCASIGELRIG